MRLVTIVACVAACSCGGSAIAQTDQRKENPATVGTGRSAPEEKGQLQPQGWTGPIETRSGGAPPESPQGQSPPGMQPAPDGSTKIVVEPNK